jgi:hypothetical protein
MREWTTSKISITHGKPKIKSNSHNNSKLSRVDLFFSQLKCIFTTKNQGWANTHFKGFNMETHWVFTFLNNFNPLVSKGSTNLVNFENFLRLCAKNEYKDYSMNFMQDTKSNLDKITTAKLVLCAM